MAYSFIYLSKSCGIHQMSGIEPSIGQGASVRHHALLGLLELTNGLRDEYANKHAIKLQIVESVMKETDMILC